MMISPLIQKDP